MATCPRTGRKDFKCNMYPSHHHMGVEGGCTIYWSKEGFEWRFDCKIVPQNIQKEDWTTIPNKKKKKK